MIKVLFSTVFLLALCSARLTIPRSATLLKTDDENSADSSSFKTLNLTVYSADNAFYWPVSINSNPFNVLLQTARDKTFIPSGPNCIGCPGFPIGYKCYNYRTCDISDLNATVDYPLGDFSGYPGHETIALTQDIKVRSEILWGTSAKSRYDENFWFYSRIQGNLGLGSDKSQQNFIDILYEQNYIWENVFSFSVQPATRWDESYQTNITNNSYLSIGFIPEDKVNKLTWISLKPDSKYSWALPISNVKIGSKVIDTSSEKYGSEISIDSGTKGLLLSPTIFKELSSKLESLKTTNVYQENSPAFYICNDNYLDDYPNITLRVGNTDIVLNVFTYLDFAGASTKRLSSDDDRVYCQLAVRESKSGGQVLGNTFLLNNHVVFSKLNQTVGIYQEYKPIFFGIHQTFIRKYWLYMLGAAVLLVTLIMVHRKRKADQLRKELDDYSNDPSMAINN